jgi:hypothetical protein
VDLQPLREDEAYYVLLMEVTGEELAVRKRAAGGATYPDPDDDDDDEDSDGPPPLVEDDGDGGYELVEEDVVETLPVSAGSSVDGASILAPTDEPSPAGVTAAKVIVRNKAGAEEELTLRLPAGGACVRACVRACVCACVRFPAQRS